MNLMDLKNPDYFLIVNSLTFFSARGTNDRRAASAGPVTIAVAQYDDFMIYESYYYSSDLWRNSWWRFLEDKNDSSLLGNMCV